MTLEPDYHWNIPLQLCCSGILQYLPSWDLEWFLSFLLYVVQILTARGRTVLLSNFWREIFYVLAVTKVIEECFNSDLAIVSSAEDAFGFKNDWNYSGHSYVCRVLHLASKKAVKNRDWNKSEIQTNTCNLFWSDCSVTGIATHLMQACYEAEFNNFLF